MTLDKSVPVIRKILANRFSRNIFNHVTTGINTDKFEQLVTKNNLKVKISRLFSQGNIDSTIEGNNKLQVEIFKYRKLQGFVAQGPSRGFIYRINKVVTSHILDFDQVKSRAEAEYVTEKSILLAKKSAQSVKFKLENTDEHTNNLLKSHHINISRISSQLPPSILTILFNTQKGKFQLLQNKDSFWVFLIEKIIPGKYSDFSRNIQNSYTVMEVNDYLRSLHHMISVTVK
jgi:hypothetical protein